MKRLHAYKLYDEGSAYAYRVEFAVYNKEASTLTVYTYEIDLDGEILSSSNVVKEC